MELKTSFRSCNFRRNPINKVGWASFLPIRDELAKLKKFCLTRLSNPKKSH